MIVATFFLSFLLMIAPVNNLPTADLLVFNAHLYTLAPNNTVAEAMVVHEGKIIFIGNEANARQQYVFKKEINVQGKPVYPGFNDAHCHFYGYGQQLFRANLTGTQSWNEVVAAAAKFDSTNNTGWLLGRGWDQNDWAVKEFPTNELLNAAFPDKPVLLKRIDGHAAIANNKALEIASFSASTIIAGGELVKKNGKLTGVLIDNAMDSIESFIPADNEMQVVQFLLEAQKYCLAVGITSLTDAGLDKNVIDAIDSLQKSGLLKIRINAMLTDNETNRDYYFKHGPYATDRLAVRSFKFYADGTLGSRGALLKKPYTDNPSNYGLLLHSPDYFSRRFAECYTAGFQVCTHCIGDSANHLITGIYGKILGGKNTKRWRIEHAQVVAPSDLKWFAQYSIIPSIQPCFATSDMYWAKDRLGSNRMSGAYAWKSLLMQTGIIAAGSDFPIEDINPLFGFYAAITRQDKTFYPEGGFLPDQKISRHDALKAITVWPAYAEFQDETKGTLTTGRVADFVVLDNDIMTFPEHEIFKTKVLITCINGEVVYNRM